MSAATLHERLAIALAHEFRDADVAFTGLATGSAAAVYATGIPLAAMGFAQCTHAPDLTVLLAGWIHNPDLTALRQLPSAEFALDLLDLPCEAQTREYPAQWSIKRGDVTIGFSSGAQVDRAGNVNSVQIGVDRPRVRLVGPILQPEHFSVFGREVIMLPRHDRQTLVPEVDYVSGVGHPGGSGGRKRLGLSGDGPVLVITPLCIFDVDAAGLHVRSVHPGVSRDRLREATGFPLGDLADAPTTPDPSDEELHVLRYTVDPNHILLPHVTTEPGR